MDNEQLLKILKQGKGDKTGMSQEESSALSFISGQNSKFQSVLSDEAKAKKEAAKKEAERLAAKIKAKKEAALRNGLGEDEFLLTDMTDGRLPRSGKNHVMFKYPAGTWDEDMEADIPAVDPYFEWDADVLEDMWFAYKTKQNILAVGPPGTGKSSSARQLCAWIRQPFARFNGKDGIEPASFLGYAWATSGGMEWKDGLMTQAVTNGYYTCVDEVFKIPPGIQMALQSLYERDGFLMLDEKPGSIRDKHIYPRPEFRIVGTDNTKGTGDDLDKYSAGMQQDTSSLDRFGVTTEVGYLPRKSEISMFSKRYPNVDVQDITKAVSMANLVRNAFLNGGELSLTMSPRGLMTVCEAIEFGYNLKDAIDMAYIRKLSDDIEIRTANAFVTQCI